MSEAKSASQESPRAGNRLLLELYRLVKGSRAGTRDVLAVAVPQAIGVVARFTSVVLMARALGPAGLGSMTLLLTIPATVVGLSDLGVGQSALWFASRASGHQADRDRIEVLRGAFRLRLFLAVFVSLSILLVTSRLFPLLWGGSLPAKLVWLGTLLGLLSVLETPPLAFFRSCRRFGAASLLSTVQILAILVSIAVIVGIRSASVDSFVVGRFWAMGLAVVLAWAALPRGLALGLLAPPRQGERVFGRLLAAAPCETDVPEGVSPRVFTSLMVLATTVVFLTSKADVWLMGTLLSKSQVGLYSAAFRFTIPLSVALGAVNTALWPRASACRDVGQAARLLRRVLKLSTLATLPSLLYAILAPLAAPLIFGDAYSASTLLSQILCLRFCFAILACPIGLVGYAFGLVRVAWIVNVAQGAIVVALNLALLPVYGAMGAAIALLVSDIFGTLVIGILIWLRYRKADKRSEAPSQPESGIGLT